MKCLDCLKNEEELNQIGRAAAGTLLLETNQQFKATNNTKPLIPLECYGKNCALQNISTTNFIQANVASLDVFNNKESTTNNPHFYDDNEGLFKELGSIEDITSNAFSLNLNQSKIVSLNTFEF